MSARDDIILGIDFGTSYSSAAILTNGRVDWVLDRGEQMIPSVVHIPNTGKPIVGIGAQMRLVANPANTVQSIKRMLGRRFEDREVRIIDAGVGYRIEKGPKGLAILHIANQEMACEQVAAYILEYLRELAEKRFGQRIRKAIIAVPAAATPGYIAALRRSARLAQLQLLEVIAEPIAGALSLGMHTYPGNRRIAVCDFGGGTFDATIVEQEDLHFVPVACHGDSDLGGDDFDVALATAIAQSIRRRAKFDIQKDVARWRSLLMRCESAKRILSSEPEARLSMTDAFLEGGTLRNLDVLIDRLWAEKHWRELLDRMRATLEQLLTNANLSIRDIDQVALIGGTSLIPAVRREISDFFERRDVRINEHAHVAVAHGTALQTAGHLAVATNVPSLAEGTGHPRSSAAIKNF